jgi:hypothetical protein
MFSCFSKTKVLDSIVPITDNVVKPKVIPTVSSPIVNTISSRPIKLKLGAPKRTLLGDPSPTPVPNLPLNKVQPPTPDLTPDEITKIQKNLQMMKDFNKDLWLQQTAIISEVWAKLKAQYDRVKQSSTNPADGMIAATIEVAAMIFAIGALIPSPLEPVFAVFAIVLGTTSSILSDTSTSTITGGDDLSGYTGDHYMVNNANYYAMNKALDYYYGHTNDCRDYIFSFKCVEKTATLRDLIDKEFEKGIYYDNWLCLCSRIYRRKLVMPELVKPENQFLDIYFVQDVIDGPGVEHGHVYQPCAAPHFIEEPWYKKNKHGPGVTRERNLDAEGVGKGVGIWSNAEIRHFQPSYVGIDIYGGDNTDLKENYRKSIGDFVKSFPSAIVFPWEINESKVYSQKYYIVSGFAKLKDDENTPFYTLCDGEFLNWLFIDDGAGNITNVNGVIFRYEAIRTKNAGFDNDLFLHAQQIGDYNPGQVDSKYSGLTFAYGPTNSSDINKKFHVYTGDLLLKNLPQ